MYSATWPEHLQTLEMVFDRLAQTSLTVLLSKCLGLGEFGKAVVTDMGKQVGQGQVRPVEEKVAVVKAYPAPTTRRDLHRFLGMAGYYRSFCKNFSELVLPLTNLLHLLLTTPPNMCLRYSNDI